MMRHSEHNHDEDPNEKVDVTAATPYSGVGQSSASSVAASGPTSEEVVDTSTLLDASQQTPAKRNWEGMVLLDSLDEERMVGYSENVGGRVY